MQILPSSSAIVKNACILQILVVDLKLWSKASLFVQEFLWQVLESLVRQNHPYAAFNVLQFKRARVVEQLLIGCQVIDTIPSSHHVYVLQVAIYCTKPRKYNNAAIFILINNLLIIGTKFLICDSKRLYDRYQEKFISI